MFPFTNSDPPVVRSYTFPVKSHFLATMYVYDIIIIRWPAIPGWVCSWL